jgi:hypothetical protein
LIELHSSLTFDLNRLIYFEPGILKSMASMSKSSKITFKTYLNDRLQQVPFHGKRTYPLYIQVTFERKSMVFKSSYFELFSKPRFVLFSGETKHGPSIDQVISKEKELIEYVIEKTRDNFSLDLFREVYMYYGRDLCDLTETGFSSYLFTFFHDKGMPALATAIQEGGKLRMLYDVVRDLHKALNKTLYEELIENSFFYAPPYLPLFGFMLESKKWPMLSFVVMEWNNSEFKQKFEDYVLKHYPSHESKVVIKQVNKWVNALRASHG